jgi:hypothetical protein
MHSRSQAGAGKREKPKLHLPAFPFGTGRKVQLNIRGYTAAGSRLVLQMLRCMPQNSGANNPETDIAVPAIRVAVVAAIGNRRGRTVAPSAAA